MSGLLMGRVIMVHQHDNSLDIQLVFDGSRLTGVPLMVPVMTTSSGVSDMHHPEGNDWDAPGSRTRDIYVIVSRTDGGYIALGYISPQVNQMMFDRKDFKIDRHASDVYSTISSGGEVEIAHPSGTFIRIGEKYDHEDLTAQDVDGLWLINRNLHKKPGMRVQIKNQDSGTMAVLTIKPDGSVDLTHKENLTVNTEKDISIKAVNIAFSSSTFTHNGVNVGSTHVHGGVIPGADDTESPH